MEVSVGLFRLILSYDNPRHFEAVEVQADNISAAEAICVGMVEDYESLILSLESRNVFVSKRMCGCEVDQNTASSSFITTVT
jgi:hypothetical protein